MNRTFLSDKHYEHCDIDEATIINGFRDAFTRYKWSSLGYWYKKGTLGHAYVLPKDKDPIHKDRPIVPASKHPLRSILNKASRVWLFLLRNLRFSHFNLLATKNLKDRISSIKDDDCLLFSFDVKNMYTELKHEIVLDSLREFLSMCDIQFDFRKVLVGNHKKGLVAVAGPMKKGKNVWFSIDNLFNLAKFELNNTFFRVGSSVILRQIIGLSMGGYQSPPMAMIVASLAEYKWLKTLGSDSKYIHGSRFMDDGVVFVSRKLVSYFKIILGFILKCYPKGLDLEITSYGYSTSILESYIWIDKEIHMFHLNKNRESIKKNQCQKIKKFIPWESAHNRNLLKNSIFGLFHRIISYTLELDFIELNDILAIFRFEFMSVGYPRSIFDQVFKKFVRVYNNATDSLKITGIGK